MKRKPFNDFVSLDSTPLYVDGSDKKTQGHLLWGDGVRPTGQTKGKRVEVRARGRKGWVEKAALGGKSLLEVYFIDVGQGDGVLIKTPDFRHIMIDGGHPRHAQNTGKNAADFVDWKFAKDYGRDTIELDAVIASHNDIDHYGGISDLLDVAQINDLDAQNVSIERLYHAGLSWWVGSDNKRTLGRTDDGGDYFIQLLGDRESAAKATTGTGVGKLQGAWGEFIARAVAARNANKRPTPIMRLGHLTEYLPGFGQDQDDVTIRVLGPIEATIAGKPALPKYSSVSTSTNGNSILLRLDYGRARILLTGDLNTESQNDLLETYSGDRLQFQCDVAKGCHHGSDDVSFAFLQAMNAGATVISSGDSEGHDHPRPRIVAASGATGHLTVQDDKIITPLVYSTELARSVSFGTPLALKIPGSGGNPTTVDGTRVAKTEVSYREVLPGALNPRTRQRALDRNSVVAGLIYGLVNVRTDGETILTATMNEGKADWSVKKFRSRF